MPEVAGYQFADFEFDVRSGELRRRGLRIRLQEQPVQVLRALLERPGEVVSREELQQRLWPADALVDFERGLNNAVRRLREALLDDADAPRFVETEARRGYRLVAPVKILEPGAAVREAPPSSEPSTRWITVLVAGLMAGAIVVAGLLAVRARSRASRPGGLMLVVLPFENLSGDPEQEYFSDGLTEEMIAQLSMLRPESLRVIARTSAMQYKRTSKTADQIGRELGVDYILEGSVRRAAGRVRITVQLVEAASQTHLWTRSYERDLADVLSLQKEVAVAVAGEVRVELSRGDKARLAAKVVDPEAYLAYLKGRHLWNRRTRESLEHAIVFFSRATAQDPAWTPPLSGLADAHVFLAWYAHRAPLDVFPKAKEAALAAVARDPVSAEAHASLGLVRYLFDWNFPSAEQELQRACALNPNYAYARYWHGYFLLAMQRHAEGLAEVKAALELDPLSPGIGTGLAYAQLCAGRPDEAIAQSRRVLELAPDYYLAHKIQGWALEDEGRYDEALAAYDRDQASSGIDTDFERARAYALAGRAGEAREALSRYERSSASRYVSIGNRARVYVVLGEKDTTLALLEQAYRDRSVNLVTPRFRAEFRRLAADARFQDLVRRVGLPGAAGVGR
jgi:TolB-like protein/DNA-binding winged helix-turn-helix (wHTH) protein/Flp pilus assembly protein TadD